MKALIIVIAVVILLQLAVIGVSFMRADSGEPTEQNVEDGSWKAPDLAGWFDGLLDPVRPRLELAGWGNNERRFAGGTTEVRFENGHEDRRVAKFELTDGTGVRITYRCDESRDACDEPQVVCLCNSTADDEADFAGCRFPGNRCPAGADNDEIFVDRKTGVIEFEGLGAAGGTVRRR